MAQGIRLETSVREVNGYVVLDVTGEVDVCTAPSLKEALMRIIGDGQNHLLINLEHVGYMDSSGFGTLLSALKRVRPEGGSINLIKCGSVIDRMLRITRLDTIFNIYSSEDEAIGALVKAAAK